MCLYPKLLPNPKYQPNKKNGGRPPECKDPRTKWIPVGCQKCMECMRQKARGWSIRLMEEIKQHKKGHKHFLTLTFSNESIKHLQEEIAQQCVKEDREEPTGYELDNEIATLAVRRFTERWRAKYGTTVRHWLVTELGHQGTQNIHLHGILFTDQIEDIAKVWKYGYIWKGTYVNEATINYVIKYCTKMDLQHKYYKPRILCSKGIGKNYIGTHNSNLNKFNEKGETKEVYRTRDGFRIALPTYYRNKIYTEEQREQLWIQKIDKKERWVDGSRVSIEHGDRDYYQTLLQARKKNQRLGYGNDEEKYDDKQYEHEHRVKLHGKRAGIHTGDMENTTTKTPLVERHRDREINSAPKGFREWLRKNVQGTNT